MEIDINKIAKLSRLSLEPEKIEKFQNEMKNIIEMVEKLPDLDDIDLSPSIENKMDLRDDVVIESYSRDEILKNAPESAAGCVVVPKTVG